MEAFFVSLASVAVAEMGDKTQIATVALAAAYPMLAMVVAGTTLGMLLAKRRSSFSARPSPPACR
jgi:Ca2+/H+ antiporter, TMEM165/GDT1 family